MGLMLSELNQVFAALFDITEVWWLVAKAVIWFIVAFIIIVKSDSPEPAEAFKDLRSTLGFFLMFLIVSGSLIYLLFSQVPA